MKVIWKFPIDISGGPIIVPPTYKILHFNVQHGLPCVWVEVDPADDRRVELYIRIFGTGHEIPGEFTDYIGTIFIDDGTLVFHAYLSNKMVNL